VGYTIYMAGIKHRLAEEKPEWKIYMKGDRVPSSVPYICDNCGTTVFFNEGDTFDSCPSCHAGSDEGPEGFQEIARVWRMVAPPFESLNN